MPCEFPADFQHLLLREQEQTAYVSLADLETSLLIGLHSGVPTVAGDPPTLSTIACSTYLQFLDTCLEQTYGIGAPRIEVSKLTGAPIAGSSLKDHAPI